MCWGGWGCVSMSRIKRGSVPAVEGSCRPRTCMSRFHQVGRLGTQVPATGQTECLRQVTGGILEYMCVFPTKPSFLLISRRRMRLFVLSECWMFLSVCCPLRVWVASVCMPLGNTHSASLLLLNHRLKTGSCSNLTSMRLPDLATPNKL